MVTLGLQVITYGCYISDGAAMGEIDLERIVVAEKRMVMYEGLKQVEEHAAIELWAFRTVFFQITPAVNEDYPGLRHFPSQKMEQLFSQF